MSNQVTIKMTVKGVPMELTGTMEEVMSMSQKMTADNAAWEDEQKKKAEKKDKEQDVETIALDIYNKVAKKATEAAQKISGIKSKEVEAMSTLIVSAVAKKAAEKTTEWMKKVQKEMEKPSEKASEEKEQAPPPVNPS